MVHYFTATEDQQLLSHAKRFYKQGYLSSRGETGYTLWKHYLLQGRAGNHTLNSVYTHFRDYLHKDFIAWRKQQIKLAFKKGWKRIDLGQVPSPENMSPSNLEGCKRDSLRMSPDGEPSPVGAGGKRPRLDGSTSKLRPGSPAEKVRA